MKALPCLLPALLLAACGRPARPEPATRKTFLNRLVESAGEYRYRGATIKVTREDGDDGEVFWWLTVDDHDLCYLYVHRRGMTFMPWKEAMDEGWIPVLDHHDGQPFIKIQYREEGGVIWCGRWAALGFPPPPDPATTVRYLPLLDQAHDAAAVAGFMEARGIEPAPDPGYEEIRKEEGLPPIFWGLDKPRGCLLKFDGDRVLRTIFIYLDDIDGYTATSLDGTDVEHFATREEAAAHAREHGIPATTGEGEFLGTHSTWIRLCHGRHWIHYEYRQGKLVIVTLSTEDPP